MHDYNLEDRFYRIFAKPDRGMKNTNNAGFTPGAGFDTDWKEEKIELMFKDLMEKNGCPVESNFIKNKIKKKIGVTVNEKLLNKVIKNCGYEFSKIGKNWMIIEYKDNI
jgi:hypothetical protein